MDPSNPPLPTAWNLPFQFASGIHTSTLISESGDGLNVAATRQNAGSCLKMAFGCADPRPVAGGENAPAATDCANVIVVFGHDKASRLSHVAAYDSGAINRTNARPRPKLRRFMVSPPNDDALLSG
jgi:hypothetical protein